MKRLFLILLSTITIFVISCNPTFNKKTTTENATQSLFKIEEGFVDAHGAMIYYMAVGKGQPLVIVHGGPGASHDYFLPYTKYHITSPVSKQFRSLLVLSNSLRRAIDSAYKQKKSLFFRETERSIWR